MAIQAQSPGGVSGVTLWYKSDLGVTNSSGVTAWTNSGTGTYNLAPNTTKPTYNTVNSLINFNPTVGFNGVDNYLLNSTIPPTIVLGGTIATSYTSSQFVVVRSKSDVNQTIYFHSNST